MPRIESFHMVAAVVALMVAGSIFTVGMEFGVEVGRDMTIEDAQLQISDAVHEAEKFRRSLECTAETPTGCLRWEPRVQK